MRALIYLLAGLGAAAAAHADLYRWIDPQTGSVKYSSVPPPWHDDAARERGAPPVEVVPYRAAPPAPRPQAERAPEPEKPAEARWRAALESLASLVAAGDAQSMPALRQQLAAFQALSAELGRLDPAGEPRRRTQAASLLGSAAK